MYKKVITMTNELIINLEKMIQEGRLQLKKQEEALILLKGIQPKNEDIENYNIPNMSMSNQNIIVNRHYDYSFINTIGMIVKGFNDEEFGVNDVEKELRKHVTILPKNPRSRIAMVLQTLSKKGKVICTFKGAGCVPYRYKSNFSSSHTSCKAEPKIDCDSANGNSYMTTQWTNWMCSTS